MRGESPICITAKKKKKNDSFEGGMRKRAETEGKECWKKKKERTGGCVALHLVTYESHLQKLTNFLIKELIRN